MALRRPPTTFSDEISAADLAANSVGASELADNAVDSDAIAANAVVTAKILNANITTDKIANDAVDADKLASNAVVSASIVDNAVIGAKIAAETIEVKPHIKPGTLYPAVSGNKLDGTATANSTTGPAGSTVAQSRYGTVQSDGRMYYYTDIKGSKPIKDPRIGAHFGSQRFPATSYQRLHEETSSNGKEVCSVDGREWMRRVGDVWTFANGADGVYTHNATGDATNSYFFEIVGYFNAANYKSYTGPSRDINVFVDGTQNPSSTFAGGSANVGSPLSGRYVSNHSVVNIPFTGLTSPAIRTLKLANVNGDYLLINGIELIAQDTTSTATRSQIQIQPQNVVSYGKKYSVGIAQSTTDKKALHYNPFAFKTDGTTAWASGAHNGTSFPVGTGSSHNIDTATSLGLANWLHSSNYYKPYNGGRVVIWVDSAGTVKTSVNVMPPNAQNFAGSAITAKANASIANNTYLPTFSGAIDQSQSEIAKAFNYREFGNGSANGGPGATYADASMVTATEDAIAYVMDDGLTSLACADARGYVQFVPDNTGDYVDITFIGTGFSTRHYANAGVQRWSNVAQNLPYGTHVIRSKREATHSEYTVDGVVVAASDGALGTFEEVYFHQPKMPPIPEDATIISDYMLMADFVAQTPATNQGIRISKGCRLISASRDIYYWDGSPSGGATDATHHLKPMSEAWIKNTKTGLGVIINGNTTDTDVALPYFGFTSGEFTTRSVGDAAPIHVNLTNAAGTLQTTNVTVASSVTISSQPTVPQAGSDGAQTHTFSKSDGVVGSNKVKFNADGSVSSSYDWIYFGGMSVASPIHTSSHYQTFETPYLHELVGGDRNMEQNNLIVTPDGKSWDEVTRDTSYQGPSTMMQAWRNGGNVAQNTYWIWNQTRGLSAGGRNIWARQKNIAIGADRIIILEDGTYNVYYHHHMNSTGYFLVYVYINGTIAGYASNFASNIIPFCDVNINVVLERGDYLTNRTTTSGAQLHGAGPDENMLVITKLD